jgi:hypothetical protein
MEAPSRAPGDAPRLCSSRTITSGPSEMLLSALVLAPVVASTEKPCPVPSGSVCAIGARCQERSLARFAACNRAAEQRPASAAVSPEESIPAPESGNEAMSASRLRWKRPAERRATLPVCAHRGQSRLVPAKCCCLHSSSPPLSHPLRSRVLFRAGPSVRLERGARNARLPGLQPATGLQRTDCRMSPPGTCRRMRRTRRKGAATFAVSVLSRIPFRLSAIDSNNTRTCVATVPACSWN